MMRPAAGMRALALLCALGPLGGIAAAQTCTAPIPNGSCTAATTTSLTIPDVMQLTLTSASTALGTPAAADYDAGFVANMGPTATVKSNRAWRLQISAGAATWTAVNTPPFTARANKPAADLQWGTGGPLTALSTTPATAASGSATGGTPAGFVFHTVYSWGLDAPGSYSLAIVFTLLAP